MSADPIRLDDYRPTAPLRLLKPCPEHDTACEPLCEARWGQPTRRADPPAEARLRAWPELRGKGPGL